MDLGSKFKICINLFSINELLLLVTMILENPFFVQSKEAYEDHDLKKIAIIPKKSKLPGFSSEYKSRISMSDRHSIFPKIAYRGSLQERNWQH